MMPWIFDLCSTVKLTLAPADPLRFVDAALLRVSFGFCMVFWPARLPSFGRAAVLPSFGRAALLCSFGRAALGFSVFGAGRCAFGCSVGAWPVVSRCMCWALPGARSICADGTFLGCRPTLPCAPTSTLGAIFSAGAFLDAGFICESPSRGAWAKATLEPTVRAATAVAIISEFFFIVDLHCAFCC